MLRSFFVASLLSVIFLGISEPAAALQTQRASIAHAINPLDAQDCSVYPIAINTSTLAALQPGGSTGELFNGAGEGHFGWLRWNDIPGSYSESYLVQELQDPTLSFTDFEEAGDPTDHYLNASDWAWGMTGALNSSEMRDTLTGLVDAGTTLRVPVWDVAQGEGSELAYHIQRFVFAQLTDFDLTDGRLRLTYIGEDSAACPEPDDLTIAKSASPGEVSPGQTLTYTLAFSNAGIGPATGVVISDELPLVLTDTHFTHSGAAITPTGGVTYAWEVQDLGQGEGGVITITGQVRSDLDGGFTFTNSATITGTNAEGDTGNNIGVAPVLAPSGPPAGGGAPPSGSRVPKISIGEAQPVPAGSTITILLEDHQPSTTYDVFFDNILVGTVTTSAQYAAQIQYYIPLNMAGDHTIHSELPGSGAAVASALVQVDQGISPVITVDNGIRWPRGSPITIRILMHDPSTTYNIYFAGALIGTITTDGTGAGSLAYTIPTSAALGTAHIESRVGSFSPAGTDIVVTQPSIVVQGGTVWPPGTLIFIILRDHAPGQTYSVYFHNAPISSTVTVNATGEAILSYVIPVATPDGIYAITSRQGTATLAQLNVQVATPPTPYIVIPGGYEWPAGSSIIIQLRKHSANMNYRVYFGSNYLGTFLVDAAGQANIAYSIPVTQTTSIVRVRSVRTDNGNQEAAVDVTVTAVPTISVDGGLTQTPGAAITIRLTHHAGNAAYDVYLGGLKIGAATTDGSGQATLTYTIPGSTAAGSYPLESRPRDQSTAVASTTLKVLMGAEQIHLPIIFKLG